MESVFKESEKHSMFISFVSNNGNPYVRNDSFLHEAVGTHMTRGGNLPSSLDDILPPTSRESYTSVAVVHSGDSIFTSAMSLHCIQINRILGLTYIFM